MYHKTFIVIVCAASFTFAAPTFAAQAMDASYALPRDTTWVDHPTPVLTMEALDQLVDLWSAQKYRGACLRGEVKERVGIGRVAYVTHISPSYVPSSCPGYGFVGAVLFFDDEEARLTDVSDTACRLLLEHHEWGIVGAVSGIIHDLLRDPEGNVVGEGATPVAWFCGWNRRGDTTLTAATT
jgi:hypothetical protein